MNIKHILIGCVIGLSMQSGASNLTLSGLAACQQHPCNGLVDILVTFTGESNDVAKAECFFVATNNETKCAVPVEHITFNLGASGADDVWTRKFVWDAKSDVGMVKIDDVALTVKVTIPDGVGGVQLWENGPYWAECNVGASQPEEAGYYFWWGDTVGYKRNANNNGWISVKDSSSFSFSSENCPTYGKNYSQLQLDGYIDAMGNLVAEHDAATAYLGVPWRMPTTAEFLALRSNCDTEWTTRNGVSGRLVKGRGTYASKSIFLPAAASGNYSSISGTAYGYYLSSTSTSHPDYSECLCVGAGNGSPSLDVGADYRSLGQSVRSIRDGSEPDTFVGSMTVHFQVNFMTVDDGETSEIEYPDDEPIPEIEWSYVIRDGEAMIFNGGKCAIPVGTTGAVVVPAELGGCPVTKIGGYAFYGCSELTSVTIPHEVIEIGSYAFGCCSNLVSITGIGDNVLQIGEGAFSGCSKITSMHIPSNLKSIPSSLFRGCKSLECVVMGNGVTNIEKQAFSGCSSLDDMKLSPALESIGEYAFSGCPTAFPLPASVRKIDWHIFSAPVDELVLDGCVTKDMEWPFTRREVGTYYDQDPYNGYYYRDYSKDVASGVLKIFEWNDTGENFHLTLEDSWSLYYTDVSITPFRTGREYHEWSPPIVYRRDAEISIVPAARSVIQGRTAISLLAPHEDVELFYTIDGSDPRTNGIKYEQKFSIRGKTTVRAVGYYKGNLTTKELVAKYGTGEVSTPVITSSQPEFNFSGNQIAIACATSGVQIHYTTDGSEPTADSPLYSAPFCIDETTMIKAIAVGHAEYMDSLIAVREFKREWLTVPSPVVSPGDGGSFDTIRGVVTIECPLSGATIYYTTDGTKPTRQSPVYSGPFEIDSDTVVRAFASKVDYLDSAFVKATIYNRQPFAATPVISLAGGGNSFVGSKGVVSIACATEGAVLHYTLDGSTPTAESPIYMEPFGITETTTVKAFASKLGCRDSEVATATFEKQWTYGDSLGCPDMTFVSEGGDWVADPDVSYDGTGSLRSPMVVQDGNSYALYTVVDGPQQVSFFWLASCEKDEWDEFFYDHAEFWVDDILVAQIDGQEKAWSYVEAKVQGSGSHTVKWIYVKDSSGKAGKDCIWIDSLRFGRNTGGCTIAFDPMGGDCVEKVRVVRSGDVAGQLPVPTSGSNGFVGWFTHPVLGDEITEESVVHMDMILYAHWAVVADRLDQTEIVDGYTWIYDVFKNGVSEVKGVRIKSGLQGDLVVPDFLGGCPVISLVLPECIVEDSFFSREDIRSIKLPQYLCSIADWALQGMSGMTSVEIGPFLETIGRNVFDSCEDFEEIAVAQDNVRYSSADGVLYDKKRETLIKCPQGRTACSIPNGVKVIGENSFVLCSKLTSLSMPDSVERIEDFAFQVCTTLESVAFSRSLKEIGNMAFYSCSSLADVVLPEGLTNIDDYAFYCSGVARINIPRSVEHIGMYAFSYCTKLGEGAIVVDDCLLCVNGGCSGRFVVQDGVRLIVGGAFCGESITSVVIPGSVAYIGRGAFEGCEFLESVTISEGVRNVESSAFSRCPLLQKVNIPRSVSYIGTGAFEGFPGSLRHVVLMFDGAPPRVEGAILGSAEGSVQVYPNQGWELYVKQGTWNGVPIEYRGDILEHYHKISKPTSAGSTEDLYVERTWHESYPNFVKMYGSTFPNAYLQKTGKRDASGAPMYVWQDYVAGTDPTDVNSVFKAKITMVDGKPKVEWEPNLNENGVVREYKVFGKENLTDAEWQSPISDQCKFFKVEVSMPK